LRSEGRFRSIPVKFRRFPPNGSSVFSTHQRRRFPPSCPKQVERSPGGVPQLTGRQRRLYSAAARPRSGIG
jgi:hypothetical protein